MSQTESILNVGKPHTSASMTGKTPAKHHPLQQLDDEKVYSIAKTLSECTAACYTCAEHAEAEHIDCEKTCRACSELCQTSLKWLTLRIQSAPELFQVNRHICSICRDQCIQHKTAHCQRCAEACESVVVALTDVLGETETGGESAVGSR